MSYTSKTQTAHERLLEEIVAEVRATAVYTGVHALSEKVLHAMRVVPRDKFVGVEYKIFAYDNHPLPIGDGQTISQPYIVAIMTELLNADKQDRVLEIGTGSGYQAAVLSCVVKDVYSVEIVERLSTRASHTLKSLGYDNVHCKAGDGYEGWPEHAPYDGIIVTAAATHIPEPLVQQLKIGKRMVIPVGMPYFAQSLFVVTRTSETDYETKEALAVAFVPLTGTHAKAD